MARRCDLTNKGVQTGHKVSHSNRKAKKRFKPNIQQASMYSEALDRNVALDVPVSTIRTVDHNGGLDNYLLTTSNLKLTDKAKRLKKLIKKTLDSKKAA